MAQNNVSKRRNLGGQIKELRKKGLSYRQIEKKLNCSKSSIAYHLTSGQKQIVRERQQARKAPFVTYNRKGKGV